MHDFFISTTKKKEGALHTDIPVFEFPNYTAVFPNQWLRMLKRYIHFMAVNKHIAWIKWDCIKCSYLKKGENVIKTNVWARYRAEHEILGVIKTCFHIYNQQNCKNSNDKNFPKYMGYHLSNVHNLFLNSSLFCDFINQV